MKWYVQELSHNYMYMYLYTYLYESVLKSFASYAITSIIYKILTSTVCLLKAWNVL